MNKLCLILVLFLITSFLFITITRKSEQFADSQLPCSIKDCDKYNKHFRDNIIIDTSSSNIVHMVDPKHPCCIKSCLNDFTYDNGNIAKSIIKDKSLFYTTRCNECILNFEYIFDLLKTGNIEVDSCTTKV